GDARDISALAVDDVRGVVWSWGPKHLLRAYSFYGAPLLSGTVSLPGNSQGESEGDSRDDSGKKDPMAFLAVDFHDGSVRLGTEKTVLKINSDATVARSLNLSSPVRGMALDTADLELWVASGDSLVAYDGSFSVLRSIALGKENDVASLSADDSSGKL